nr:DUF3784 domain-containing protein [Anaerococcus sp. AGMB09787]
MRLLSIILTITGIVFTIFGYLIYFKKNYTLINGFESDLVKGRKDISYGKKVGLVELILGVIMILIGTLLFIYL